MAVVLFVGIFSMLDTLIKYEKTQILKSEGNYHILIRNPTQNEIELFWSRIDVENSGSPKDLGAGTINDTNCALGSIDGNSSKNLNIVIVAGGAPTNDNEIMFEKWYMDQS